MQVTITGRLGKEPEIKYYESGKNKTTFSLAVGDYNAATKEKCASWFNVEVWDKKAEFVAEHCKKGAMVTVTGYLKEEFNENNSKLYYKIVANDVRFDGAYITLNGIVNKVEDRIKEITRVEERDEDGKGDERPGEQQENVWFRWKSEKTKTEKGRTLQSSGEIFCRIDRG